MKNKLMKKLAVTLLATTACTLIASSNAVAKNEHKRIYGQNRIETSIKISEEGWKNGSKVAVIAQGYNYADALCASSLAKKYNAPIILTSSSKLDESTIKELKRLNVEKVFITGGKSVVSEEVERQLKSLNIKDVKRLYGKSRYETSLEVAKEIGNPKEIFITSGNGYADSLSVAPIAAKKGAPILFADKNYLKESVKKYIDSIKDNNTYVIGGQGVITNNAVKDIKNVERISGKDRFKTNKNVLSKFKEELTFNNIYIVQGAGPNGNEFADALSCSALASQESSPIVLMYESIDEKLKDFIKENLKDSSKIIAIGGDGNVPSKVIDQLSKIHNDNNKNRGTSSSSSGRDGFSSSSGGSKTEKPSKDDKKFMIKINKNKVNIVINDKKASEATITLYDKNDSLIYIGQSELQNSKVEFNTKLDSGEYHGYYRLDNIGKVEIPVCLVK